MKQLSEKSLSNVALFYLRRYSASRKGLERVLEQKVKRHLREKGGELGPAKILIAQVVARMVQDGSVDDTRMAESKTASLHRQGKSSRVIELKLREKGIEPGLAKNLALTTPEQELEAACTLVKKKRLGVDPERRQKDFAVLMRAGFNSEVAKRALLATADVSAGEKCPVIQLPIGKREFAALSGEECRVLQLALPAKTSAFVTPERDLEAARTLVKKKRLGAEPERKQKDLGVLLRAGFKYDVARRALSGPIPPPGSPEV